MDEAPVEGIFRRSHGCERIVRGWFSCVEGRFAMFRKNSLDHFADAFTWMAAIAISASFRRLGKVLRISLWGLFDELCDDERNFSSAVFIS